MPFINLPELGNAHIYVNYVLLILGWKVGSPFLMCEDLPPQLLMELEIG